MTFNVFNLGCIHTQRPFLRQVQGLSPLYQGLNVHMCGLGGQSKGRSEGRQSFSFFFLLFFLSWSLIRGSSHRYIRCTYVIALCMTHLAFVVVKADVPRRSIKRTALSKAWINECGHYWSGPVGLILRLIARLSWCTFFKWCTTLAIVFVWSKYRLCCKTAII